MKKNFVLLFGFFLSSYSFAQKYEAKLTLSNGIIKTGLADLPSDYDKKGAIKFKKDQKSDLENILVKEIQGADYIVNAVPLTYYRIPYEKTSFLAAKNYDEKNLKMYVSVNQDPTTVTSAMGNKNTIPAVVATYFLQYKDEPIEPVMSWWQSGMLFQGNMFQRKSAKKYLTKYFKEKCPAIETALKNEEIKFVDNPMPFIEYFQKNCNTN